MKKITKILSSKTIKEQINKEKLQELEKDYTIMSLDKMENNLYSEEELNNYIDLMKEHFYVDGIINCSYIEGKIIKYGLLKLEYLKQNNKALYTSLLMNNELENHLISVSNEGEFMLNTFIENYKKQDEKLTEKSKSLNQLEWVKLMNNYKNTADEIIKKEIINV